MTVWDLLAIPGDLLLACAVLTTVWLAAGGVIERLRHGRLRALDEVYATIPSASEKLPARAASPRPAPGQPGFTERELRTLASIDAWAPGGCDPVRRESATVMADLFRQHSPHLSDDDLGRVLLAAADIAKEYGVAGTAGRLPGTFALAAAALTRLTRTDVHLDQH